MVVAQQPSSATADRWLRWACRHRLLFRVPVPLSTLRAALPHAPRSNYAYSLDWNGYFLLRSIDDYEDAVATWNYRNVAHVTATTKHHVQVEEAWSYMLAFARATHLSALGVRPRHDRHVDLSTAPLHPVIRLGYEREPVLGAGRTRERAQGATLQRGGVRPDAELLLEIDNPERLIAMPPEPISYYLTYMETALHPTIPDISWCYAYTPGITPLDIAEAMSRQGHTAYARILLELETGSRYPAQTASKIADHVALLRQPWRWQRAYGQQYPQILVVMPHRSLLSEQVAAWRKHWPLKKVYSVVATSLDLLDAAWRAGLADGPVEMLRYPAFFDASLSGGPEAVPFGTAFGISGMPAPENSGQPG